jgi:fructosamine-3-kinase
VSLEAAVGEAAGAAVTSARRVGGGDINDAWAMELDDGRRVFVKTRADAPAGEYEAEAAALAWLAEPGAVRVPAVVAVGDGPAAADGRRAEGGGARFLALEWVESGRLDAAGEEELGRGLAGLHRAGAPAFGAYRDVHELGIGPLSFDVTPAGEWPAFYAERLLLPLLPRASALPASGARAVERVCERIAELAGPAEPPARLHGDLWSGNVLPDAEGRPWLVDPAAYGGHREVDLAMLKLFGAPSARTMAAYEEAFPLADAHEERVRLWQLFPLLVHTVLFGGGYGASAEDAARRYAG